MFTGLVELVAVVEAVAREAAGIRLTILRPVEFTDVRAGDSLAINGCCLTVAELSTNSLSFQAGEETLSRTNLGSLRIGSAVNCERAMQLGQRVGGHLVTGHIDGQGRLALRDDDGTWCRMVFEASRNLMRQMVAKGSIAVDGVSLTIVDVSTSSFSVALIPYTLAHTTLGRLSLEDAVNLETDLLAKYVQRQLEFTS